MSRKPEVLNSDESYTFIKYFELPFDIEDVLTDLGCTVARSHLELPRIAQALEGLDNLREQIQDAIHYVGITSEQARQLDKTGALASITVRLDKSRLISSSIAFKRSLIFC